MDLLERIKILSEKRGITISMLENQLDIPNNTIYQWKQRIPNVERLEKVADYFNVSVDYLLGREENQNTHPEYFAIQRKAKKLNQKDQARLLKIMEATFDEIDTGEFEEDDGDDL